MIPSLQTDEALKDLFHLDGERRGKIHADAEVALTSPVPHITDVQCARSPGSAHDFYSEGDYWWPNPDKPDGVPYIRRDGETNPENFSTHRLMLRAMRNAITSLTMEAMCLLQEEGGRAGAAVYAERAEQILREYFLDECTCMNPSLSYAQAIQGVCTGRGIGIIDTVHLTDVPYAVEALYANGLLSETVYSGLRGWFSAYLGWMLSSGNGIDEMNTDNNHAICFFMQAAVFARFTDNTVILGCCRAEFKQRLIRQMAPNGAFPRELARTKPYNYSAFTLDNLCLLAEAASVPEDDLWHFKDEQGRSLSRGIDFLLPYLVDKSTWPYPPDVMHFSAFPVPYAFLFLADRRLGRKECGMLYHRLPAHIKDEEALRNLSVRQPILWLMSGMPKQAKVEA